MRFATDHSSLAPHQLPELPSTQIPSTIKPDIFQSEPVARQNVANAPTVQTPPTPPTTPGQITLTINSTPNATAQTVPTNAPQPVVQINVQAPNANPTTHTTTTQSQPTSTPALVTTAKAPRLVEILRWVTTIGLAGVGLKGFADSLYFILVEFQNFEQALEENLIETANINPLITKASLLVFTTAVAIYFGMQLSMTSTKKLRLIKVLGSIIVGVCCVLVLQYANTISVLDSFKNP
jgi:hypothetical protein